MGGRSKARFRVGYDQDGVPVLAYGSPLALQYRVEAHALDHGGVNNMLMRTRNHVWIVRGARMAEWVRKGCYKCRLTERKLCQQKMAPLPESRIGPAPIFDTVAVDLFRPLEFRDMVRKRFTSKGWGEIFVCTATSAIHIQ